MIACSITADSPCAQQDRMNGNAVNHALECSGTAFEIYVCA